MYIPEFSKENDPSVLHALIKENPLGAWTTLAEGELAVNHIPFVLHETRGEFGTLVGHVARANSVWQNFSKTLESVIIFQGAEGYISPAWYPSKQQHGKVVPTWNYAVVHAYGLPKIIEDAEWLLNHLNELTNLHEQSQTLPWTVSDAPDEFIKKLLDAIVGIEIPLSRLQGKMKLGQNRPEEDQLGMVKGLMACEEAQVKRLGLVINEAVIKKGLK